MRSVIGAAALLVLLAGCNNEGGTAGDNKAQGGGAPVAAVKAPNGDWTEVVTATPEGGFRMGNPNAPVRLVEYASMTCPHCAEFSEAGVPELIDRYVKTGQLSFEIRNFVRDPADLAAALLARCSGPGAFFKLTDQLFAAQSEWLGRLQQMSPAEQQQLQTLPPNQVPMMVAQRTGLDQFARVRGIPAAKAQSCLTNTQSIDQMVEMTNAAVRDVNVQGTPSFTINGRLVENASSWDELEPAIRGALG